MTKSLQVSERPLVSIKTVRDLAYNNMLIENINANEVNNITVLVDASGSMESSTQKVVTFKQKLKKQLEELCDYYAILVSQINFDEELKGDGFQLVQDFSTEYDVGGSTALYDAVGIAGQNMLNYSEELRRHSKGFHNVFIVLSDGEDNASDLKIVDAKKVITQLNKIGHTVFIAVGQAALDVGNRLGCKELVPLDSNKLEGLLDKLVRNLSNFIEYKTDTLQLTYGGK